MKLYVFAMLMCVCIVRSILAAARKECDVRSLHHQSDVTHIAGGSPDLVLPPYCATGLCN